MLIEWMVIFSTCTGGRSLTVFADIRNDSRIKDTDLSGFNVISSMKPISPPKQGSVV